MSSKFVVGDRVRYIGIMKKYKKEIGIVQAPISTGNYIAPGYTAVVFNGVPYCFMDELLELAGDDLESVESELEQQQKQGITTSTCTHKWVETQGFSTTYRDCLHCEARWEDVVSLEELNPNAK